jgi:UDP-N-acetylmuramyl pentapeptide phosphotransferase/UDP-N-acetylglucosamine-1-phosphate transferase
LVTFVAVTICLALVRPFLANRRLVDVPNLRSSHTQPTVRGGGLGIAAGLIFGFGGSVLLLTGSGTQMAGIAAVGLTVSALAAVGLTEDARGLRVGARLISQALIFGIATVGVVLVGGLPVALGPLVGLAGVFYVNAANFMDGVNGISSLHGAVVGAYFAAVGYVGNAPGLALTGVATGVAFLAFLPWNAPRARMFMGDVGSYVLGGAAWALAVWALVLGVPPLTVAAPLLVYSADVIFTLVMRAMRGAPLTQAHHDHVYQRLMEITCSHGAATGSATVATILCAAMGLWSLFVPEATGWAIGFLLVVLFLYLMSPRFMARRKSLISSVVTR